MGQRWGVRNGPPYPLRGGKYSVSKRKDVKKSKYRNSINNKRHFDEKISRSSTTLSTLSYDKDRTKNVDMFYATHDFFDKHQYNALFNKPIPKTITNEKGESIGTGYCMKYRINNSLKNDMKIASEDSGAKAFMKLYEKDRDFYNFAVERMSDYFVAEKYKFKGYREARDVIKKLGDKKYTPTSDELQKVYRIFNYVIPYDGAGDLRKGNDVRKQRAKFFNELKKEGYGAVLDTNDAIYGGFKAKSPIIVFDMENIISKDVYETTLNSKAVSNLMLIGRKTLHL